MRRVLRQEWPRTPLARVFAAIVLSIALLWGAMAAGALLEAAASWGESAQSPYRCLSGKSCFSPLPPASRSANTRADTIRAGAAARPLHLAGVPLNYYVVVIQRSFPTVLSRCDPPACPEHLVFEIGPIDSANCVIPGFATAEDAQAWVLESSPLPGPWYTVRAIDAAHAYAMVLLVNVLGNAPNAVPPSLIVEAEQQVAAAFAQLCGSAMAT